MLNTLFNNFDNIGVMLKWLLISKYNRKYIFPICFLIKFPELIRFHAIILGSTYFWIFQTLCICCTQWLYSVAQGCLWKAALINKCEKTLPIVQTLVHHGELPLSQSLFFFNSLFNGLCPRGTAQRRSNKNCFFFLWLKCLGKIENTTELKGTVPIGCAIFSFLVFFSFVMDLYRLRFVVDFKFKEKGFQRKAKHLWNDKCYVYILLASFLKVLMALR